MILLLVRLRSRNSPWMKRAAMSTSRSGPRGVGRRGVCVCVCVCVHVCVRGRGCEIER